MSTHHHESNHDRQISSALAGVPTVVDQMPPTKRAATRPMLEECAGCPCAQLKNLFPQGQFRRPGTPPLRNFRLRKLPSSFRVSFKRNTNARQQGRDFITSLNKTLLLRSQTRFSNHGARKPQSSASRATNSCQARRKVI